VIVAVAASQQVLGFSAVTGAWTAHSASGLANADPIAAGSDVGVVAVAASDQVLAFNSSTGVWVAHSASGLTNADKVGA
jgi:hypothetical protein